MMLFRFIRSAALLTDLGAILEIDAPGAAIACGFGESDIIKVLPVSSGGNLGHHIIAGDVIANALQ